MLKRIIRWGLPFVWLVWGFGAAWSFRGFLRFARDGMTDPPDPVRLVVMGVILVVIGISSLSGFFMFLSTLWWGPTATIKGLLTGGNIRVMPPRPDDYGTLWEATKFRWHTTKHKFWVLGYWVEFATKMLWRILVHDLSKYGAEEARRFGRVFVRLKASTYSSPEYRQLLSELQPALELHYSKNSHHPEHYAVREYDAPVPIRVEYMDLYDFLEMWLDWRSAIKNHTDGDIIKSVEGNRNRFNMGDTADVLLNTAMNL